MNPNDFNKAVSQEMCFYFLCLIMNFSNFTLLREPPLKQYFSGFSNHFGNLLDVQTYVGFALTIAFLLRQSTGMRESLGEYLSKSHTGKVLGVLGLGILHEVNTVWTRHPSLDPYSLKTYMMRLDFTDIAMYITGTAMTLVARQRTVNAARRATSSGPH